MKFQKDKKKKKGAILDYYSVLVNTLDVRARSDALHKTNRKDVENLGKLHDVEVEQACMLGRLWFTPYSLLSKFRPRQESRARWHMRRSIAWSTLEPTTTRPSLRLVLVVRVCVKHVARTKHTIPFTFQLLQVETWQKWTEAEGEKLRKGCD